MNVFPVILLMIAINCLPLSVQEVNALLRNLQSSCNHFFQLIHCIHFTNFHFKGSPREGSDGNVEVVGVITGGHAGPGAAGGAGGGRAGGGEETLSPGQAGICLDASSSASAAPVLTGVCWSGVVPARILGIHCFCATGAHCWRRCARAGH